MNKDTPTLGTSIEAAQIISRITGLDSKLTSAQSKVKYTSQPPPSTSNSLSQIDRGGQASTPQQNCIFNICYNGEPRQFALAGQLLREDEEFDPLPPLIP